MSLINKMLQDLEQRRKNTPATEGDRVLLSGLKTASTKNAKQKRLVLLLIILILVVIVMAGIYIFVAPPQKKLNLAVPGAPIASYKSDKLIPEMVKEPAVILQAASFVEQGQDGLLNLNFNQPVHYYVKHGAKPNQLNIGILGARLEPNLSLPKPNNWIQALTITQEGEDLVLHLVLSDDVELKTLNLTAEKPPQLQLILFNKTLSVSVASSKMQKKIIPLTLEEQAAQQYRDAMNLVDENKTAAAMQKLRIILHNAPRYIPARETLIILLLKNHKIDDASQVAVAGLLLDPDNLSLVKLQAHIYAGQNMLGKALAIMQQHLPNLAEHLDYYALMAALYQQHGDYALAAKLYANLLQVEDDSPMWWVGLGVALESLGDKNRAQEAYRQANKFADDLPQNIRTFVAGKVNDLD